MKNRKRIIIGIVVLGLLMPAIAVGAWMLEANRGARSEALAREAIQNGDWEKAAAYAEQANTEELRAEAAYLAADEAFQKGDFETARQAFAALGAYRNSQERVQACLYAAADALEQSGDVLAARDAFFALIPYADSSDRYRACSYRIAEQYLNDGDTHKAFTAFEELIPYTDSEARAVEIAVLLTGETDPEKAVAFAKGYSEDDWAHIEQVRIAREALTAGRIAVGNGHAVFLFSDGHVEAVGEDDAGQCNVSAFRNITAVAAGYNHTLGLKADGTVVAAGDNTYGQCAVEAWSDVVSIACGAWDSFGIRKDGTLLHCGFSTYDLSGWTELRSVRACETALIGLRTDGTLLCTSADGRFTGNSYCDACITTGAAFALTEEGTLRCKREDVAAWTDLVAITNSASVLTGIRADGTLAVQPLIPCDAAYLSDLAAQENVAEVASGGSFALVLHRDGTISGCGELPEPIAAFLLQEPVL